MEIIKSKYYCGFNMPNIKESEWYIKRKKHIDSLKRSKDYVKYIHQVERAFRLDEFLKIKEDLTKEDLAYLVPYIWIDSENPEVHNLYVWKSIFKEKSGRFYMTRKERKFFNKLPDEITVYRGVDDQNPSWSGIAWTLDLKIALWFALRFSAKNQAVRKWSDENVKAFMKENDFPFYTKGENPAKKERCVLMKRINKSEAHCYFSSRGESEIIIL